MSLSTQSPYLVEAKEISKMYGQGGETLVEALQMVSIHINPGEIVSIMGPSGCGKTTLINCLSGIDLTSKGVISFEGQSLASMKENERDKLRAEKMGFVFQTNNLIPVLTALENVEMPLLYQGEPLSKAREKAKAVLERVGLVERIQHYPTQLSLGQQQRVALARALINDPKIVWADEPTGALDRQTTDLVLDLIEHVNRKQGISFVIVTHDPKVAERGDRVIYMDSGRVIQERSIMKKEKQDWISGDRQ